MLRLSKKTDYALIALKALVLSERGTSCSAREIAARYNIPVELMAKVLQRLSRRGLLESHKGTSGGYRLSRQASRISVADVIGALLGLVLTSPVMAWCAWRIRREDGGAALFRQERIGKGGRRIRIHKFRTMFADVDP